MVNESRYWMAAQNDMITQLTIVAARITSMFLVSVRRVKPTAKRHAPPIANPPPASKIAITTPQPSRAIIP